MSEDFYFYNKTKKEYIHGYGNHDRFDSLRHGFPKLLTWVMMNHWVLDEVICIGDSNNLDKVFESKNMTNYYIKEWNKNYVINKHNKLKFNTYIEEEKKHEKNKDIKSV